MAPHNTNDRKGLAHGDSVYAVKVHLTIQHSLVYRISKREMNMSHIGATDDLLMEKEGGREFSDSLKEINEWFGSTFSLVANETVVI